VWRHTRQDFGGNSSRANNAKRRLGSLRPAESFAHRRRLGLLSGGNCRGSMLRGSAANRGHLRAYGRHRRIIRHRRQTDRNRAMDRDPVRSRLGCPADMFHHQPGTHALPKSGGCPNRHNGKFCLFPHRWFYVGRSVTRVTDSLLSQLLIPEDFACNLFVR